ncbi:MAG: cyclic nucleotide-binding protein [Betaproteobacteria bacterium RIFCSPLOWO2_12_FULL_64_23]|nr:MAG: cyclic nucleotide-binding protein [Betaproteobacteria bacterium RIFCSPLOWO2_12_FULL_64_23]
MLVALPSAIAFGVTIFSPLGGTYVAQGAIAGILGVTALGLIAGAFGGTNRLITAPCAPAAAVMSALAIQLMQDGASGESAVLMLTLVGLICGAIQVSFGAVGLGRLIKYVPFPVVSGYLSGVGLIIIVSQVPKFLGVPKEIHFWESLVSSSLWQWQGVVVGVVTVAVMATAPMFTKAVPAAILGLAAGVLAYFGLGLADPALLALQGNALVIGPLGGAGAGFGEAISGRWKAVGDLDFAVVGRLLVPAATLAVLLSIDTLKTCVVLDALTRSRHNSNRELIGQGLGNLASSFVGGVPGAGQMGATLVNMSSGAHTRLSGLVEGALALVAFLVLGTFIAWIPIAALAGILIVIGFRMFDRDSLHLLKSRTTILDFAVIVAVVVVALTVSLIAASGVGIALAIVLFIREQIRGSIVRGKAYGNQMFSKRVRLPAEMEILEKRGDSTAIFELQGSLFFGTTDQLYTTLEPELKARSYIILDMRRVQSVDLTAVHMLEQIQAMLAERKAFLIFSALPANVPSGQDMRKYFDEVGLVKTERLIQTFNELDEALEWVEERLIEEEHLERLQEKPLELREIDVFLGRKETTLAALESCMDKRSYKAGEKIFARGDAGDEMFLIRRGAVRIVLPISDTQGHHLATFGRSDFFGEMAFLDPAARSADALALTDTDLFALSRKRFDTLAEEHKKLAIGLVLGVARVLAIRLRYANAELRAMHMS